MEPHPHRHQYRLIILTLFVGLALITMALIFYYQRNGMLQSPGAVNTTDLTMPLPTIVKKVPTGVRFSFESSESASLGSVNSPMKLTVVGESNKHGVLGYDIVISRDLSAYDVVGATSLLPEFTVLKFVKDDKVTVTGILKPSVTKEVVFFNTPVIELTLLPKKSGPLSLTILVSEGSSNTKIMSSGTASGAMKFPIDDPSTLRLDIK